MSSLGPAVPTATRQPRFTMAMLQQPQTRTTIRTQPNGCFSYNHYRGVPLRKIPDVALCVYAKPQENMYVLTVNQTVARRTTTETHLEKGRHYIKRQEPEHKLEMHCFDTLEMNEDHNHIQCKTKKDLLEALSEILPDAYRQLQHELAQHKGEDFGSALISPEEFAEQNPDKEVIQDISDEALVQSTSDKEIKQGHSKSCMPTLSFIRKKWSKIKCKKT